MNKTVTFTTPRGNVITVEDDKTNIYAAVGGHSYPVHLAVDPEHGDILRTSLGQPMIIPVPATAIDAVRALVADAEAARERYFAMLRREDKAAESTRRVMGY